MGSFGDFYGTKTTVNKIYFRREWKTYTNEPAPTLHERCFKKYVPMKRRSKTKPRCHANRDAYEKKSFTRTLQKRGKPCGCKSDPSGYPLGGPQPNL